jgi:hypothetical protein
MMPSQPMNFSRNRGVSKNADDVQDMHYAEFAEDEVHHTVESALSSLLIPHQSVALLNAIKEYENNKWKVIGAKVGKPAKVILSKLRTA